MASLRRLPNSRYWIACLTMPDGTRTQRSTKVPIGGVAKSDIKGLQVLLADILEAKVTISDINLSDGLDAREARRLAGRIAQQFEDASRQARAAHLTEVQARKVVANIYELANKDTLPGSTLRGFFESWLKRKELEAGPKTHQKYSSVVAQFLDYLGPRANKDVMHLTGKEIAGFRDFLAKRVTAGTVNISIKIIRAALAQAKRDGLADVNEAERVSLLKRGSKFERRPFTPSELKRLLNVANEEWRGMILFGLYTGQRLGDIADLCWNNIDLQREEIRLVTDKTGRRQILPVAPPLVRYITSLPAGDDPNAPLFPEAYATRRRNMHSGTLSNRFYNILVAAGLAEKKTHKSTGKGRSAKREQNELSFHALRHTATSLLKRAGVSDAIAREFIGHDSAAVSREYTNIDTETLRKAANAFPDILN